MATTSCSTGLACCPAETAWAARAGDCSMGLSCCPAGTAWAARAGASARAGDCSAPAKNEDKKG
eukprot:363294-Chlamydomonas_euryale.AAC.4